MEGGPPIFRQDGSCPALLEDPAAGFPYGAVTRSGPPFQTLPVPCDKATGLFRVRSPLLTESRLMSVPPATEMFQFAGFASRTYEFSTGYPYGWVAPFGDPGITDRSHLPRAFRSVPRPSSPLSAKASTRCPCFALDHRRLPARKRRTTAAHRAKTPKGQNPQRAKTLLPASAGGRPPRRREPTKPRRPRMKTLLRIDTTHYDCARAYPPRSHHNSLFTLQSTPPPQARNRAPGRYVWLLRTRQPPPVAFSAAALRLSHGGSPVVEVNGIEPMTSCLQSRRSPN